MKTEQLEVFQSPTWICCSAITDRDLKWKPINTNIESIFNFNMLSTILDGSYYQKLQKMATIALPWKIEICNEPDILLESQKC